MQGGVTYLPKIKIMKNLKESLKYIKQENFEIKILLEKDSKKKLIDIEQVNNATIIVGPERGFTEKEKQLITQYNFSSCSISSNILRTETAIIAASIITASKLINV